MDKRLTLLIEMLRKGRNQKELAAELGLSGAIITAWKKGKKMPKADSLLLIHKKYNINIHWLLTGEGEMEYKPDQKKMIEHYPEEKREFFKEPFMCVLSHMIKNLNPDERKKLIKMIAACFDQELVDCENNEPKEIKV